MAAQIRELDFDLSLSNVRKVKGIISGIILLYGKPVSREVVIYRRHDQLEVARGKSDSLTGKFTFTLSDNVNVFYRIVVIAGSSVENSQIQDFVNVVIS